MSKLFILVAMMILATSLQAEEKGKHLFILSGQSNMARLPPKLSFTPAVEKEFGKDNVIVVKSAESGAPMKAWWSIRHGSGKAQRNYDVLMKKVKVAMKGQAIASVTFIWMQGETDAMAKRPNSVRVYLATLKGLIKQMATDLKRNDLNVVIGRINDFSMDDKKHARWTTLRNIQVQAAKEIPRAAWVDSDDLNGPKNDIHTTKDGYKILGERFAVKAIALIKSK